MTPEGTASQPGAATEQSGSGSINQTRQGQDQKQDIIHGDKPKKPSGNSAIFAALGANFVIFIMKLGTAIFSGSASMMSESVHSLADCFNQLTLLVGKRFSTKPPDREHQFGHSRSRFVASLIVALLLFFVGGAYSLMEAIEKVMESMSGHLEALDTTHLLIAAGILVAGLALELFSLRTAIKEIREFREHEGETKLNLLQYWRKTKNSELVVISTEDSLACLGLLLALIGVGATVITGNPLFDALGGCAVGLLLIIGGVALGWEIINLLVGESISPEREERLRAKILQVEGIKAISNLKSSWLGPECVLVEADLVFSTGMDTATMVGTIAKIKGGIKADFREGVYVSTCIEPVAE